jgi:hypothetical protein
MNKRKRKSDRKEMAQFVWTLVVGLAAAVAALHETNGSHEAPVRERVPAAEKQHGFSPVDLLDTRRTSK